MESYQARAFSPTVSDKMYTSYKVDEGYSEDTRSQDDPDSPMAVEPGGEEMLQAQTDTNALYNAVIALGDGEKSGELFSTIRGLKNAFLK